MIVLNFIVGLLVFGILISIILLVLYWLGRLFIHLFYNDKEKVYVQFFDIIINGFVSLLIIGLLICIINMLYIFGGYLMGLYNTIV